MILGFKKQFVDKILNGTKIHTIREDRNNRWKTGNKIHFATGIRTRNYNQFYQGTCKLVQDIEIIHTTGYTQIFIDGNSYFDVFHHGFDNIYEYTQLLKEFAINDGFDTVESFFEWFDQDFKGKLIHWTDFEYLPF